MGLKSLKSKLLLAVSALVICSSLLISLLVTQRYSSSLFETMTGQAENLARSVALECADKILTHDLFALQKALDLQVRSNPAISYLFVYQEGKILSHTFAKGFPVDILDANSLTSRKQSRIQKITTSIGEHHLDIAWPIFEKKAGVLRLGLSEKPYRRKLTKLWLQTSGLILGILLLSLSGTLLFVRRITRPLAALVQATQKIDKGELGVRVQVQGKDEVGELATSFNHMTGRMEEYTRKLEDQTMELERTHNQTRTFCDIVQEIGSQRSLNEIGSFLIRRFQHILKCKQIVLLIFNINRDLLFALSAQGAKALEEPETLRTAEASLKGLKKVTFTNKVIFKPPFVSDDFQAAKHRAIVPFHYENQTVGALFIACPGGCRCGAEDFNMASLILTQTAGVIMRAISQEEELRDLRSRVESKKEFSGIIGRDSKMLEIYKLIEEIASTDISVMILGENGSGKEMVAHTIHNQSLRKDKPFIVINCSAYPVTLLESELFGHEKGAFTGATRQKSGRFEQANGGTVFLDEVGDILPSAQIKLLRVLQTQKFERVGGEKTLDVNVRIIAATNKDLDREVQKGHFREDLFYRLNVISISLPPLRERHNDIPLLAHHFLRHFVGEQDKKIEEFSPEAMRLLLDYSWPGNVRELKNSIEHATVLAKGRRIEVSDLPAVFHNTRSITIADGLLHSMEEYEKEFLQQALDEYGWNKKLAARRLGISRNTLYLKLKKYRIAKPTTH
jgi:two-component system response regulator HydG